MKKLTSFVLTLALLAGLAVPLASPAAVHAADANPNSKALCEGAGGTWADDSNAPSGGTCTSGDKGRTVVGTIQQVTDVLTFVAGAIAVLMIIVGGVRYVTSAGDQSGTKSAKDTILYAIIGLVVTFMAYAVVHFIITSFNIK